MKLFKKVSLITLLALSIGAFSFAIADHSAAQIQKASTTTIIDPGTGTPGGS